jgi:hypothetical protein
VGESAVIKERAMQRAFASDQELLRIYMRRARRKLRGRFGTEKRVAGVRALLHANALIDKLRRNIRYV